MQIYTINKLRWISLIICSIFLIVGISNLVKAGWYLFEGLWYPDSTTYIHIFPGLLMLLSFSQAAVWGVISYILTYLYKQH